MKSLKQYFWNIVLIVSITIVAMYFSLKDNFPRIVESIQQMNFFYLVLCLLWGVLFTIVWGLSYRVIARRYQKTYSSRQGIIVAFVGTFFNGITPSATGGQFAQAYVLRKQGISLSDGASILWADFIIYQTSMMIYVTLLFVVMFKRLADINSWVWIVGAGYLINAAVVVGLYLIAFFPKGMIRAAGWLGKFLGRMRLLKHPEKTVERWQGSVSNFTVQIRLLSRDWNMIFQVFVLNIIRLTLYFSLPWLIARGLGIHLGWIGLADCLTLASFVVMANSFIPLPGATGGTEVVFQLLFYPMFGALTAADMLLWRISSYYLIVILGAAVFIWFQSRNGTADPEELKGEPS